MRLSDLRKRKSLTQKQLASAIGVTESTVSKYENGSLVPPFEKILSLTKVLGKEILVLFQCKENNDFLNYISCDYLSEKKLPADELFETLNVKSSVARDFVLKRADYQCQICGTCAPENDNFLELYYVNMSNDSDTSVIDQFVAVCPNCLKLISGSFSIDIVNKLNQLVKNNRSFRLKYRTNQ